MEWLNNLVGWLRGEPEFENLEKYLAMEAARSADPSRDAAIAIALSGAAIAGLGGLAIGWLLRQPFIGGLVVFSGIVFAFSWLYQYTVRTSDEERELGKTKRTARAFVYELWHWKHRRMLKKKLGLATGELLDVAAQFYLRTSGTLNSDVWRSETLQQHWRAFRDRAIASMEAAMARLLLIAKDCIAAGTDFLAPGFESARDLTEQMREMAKESERLTDKLRIEGPGGSLAAPAEDLRQALAEAKRLEAAEEELERLRQQG